MFSTNDFAILTTFSFGVFAVLFEKFSTLYAATFSLSFANAISVISLIIGASSNVGNAATVVMMRKFPNS